MSELGKQIIDGLKEFGEQLEDGRVRHFDSWQELNRWREANPGYRGLCVLDVVNPKPRPRRVDQTPPKPYNAVVEPTE